MVAIINLIRQREEWDYTTLSWTNTQAKNYLFSQSPTTDNSAENTLSIVSISEINSSSKSSIDICWDQTHNVSITSPMPTQLIFNLM